MVHVDKFKFHMVSTIPTRTTIHIETLNTAVGRETLNKTSVKAERADRNIFLLCFSFGSVICFK